MTRAFHLALALVLLSLLLCVCAPLGTRFRIVSPRAIKGRVTAVEEWSYDGHQSVVVDEGWRTERYRLPRSLSAVVGDSVFGYPRRRGDGPLALDPCRLLRWR
jgi:hypothetical protein